MKVRVHVTRFVLGAVMLTILAGVLYIALSYPQIALHAAAWALMIVSVYVLGGIIEDVMEVGPP